MSEPFLSEIKITSFNFPPKGWALCNGQFLPINQNQALFALLGTTYGGNGQTTFALPNLRGRVPIHFGEGHSLGEQGGSTSVTVTSQQLAAHTHLMKGRAEQATLVGGTIAGAGTKSLGQAVVATSPVVAANIYATGAPSAVMSPNSVTSVGGSQPHNNMMPYLTLNFIIALIGIFPSHN